MDFPLAGIGGFMVRQRKCHTRMRRSLSASGDAVPEGQTAEGKFEEGKWAELTHKHKWLLGFLVMRVNSIDMHFC